MYVIREVMHCRPGKVRGMVDKFKAVAALMEAKGMKPFRIMTDVSGERFWSVVLETEADDLAGFFAREAEIMADEAFGKAMAGYHDLVDDGRREIFQIAG